MKINGDMLLVVVDLAEASIEMQFLTKSDRQEFSSFGISYAFLLSAIANANATYVDIISRNYYSGYYVTLFVHRCATKGRGAMDTQIVTTILDSQVEPRSKWKGCLCAKRHTDIDTLYCYNAVSCQLASCNLLPNDVSILSTSKCRHFVQTSILLGDKGCALRTVDKGIPRGIPKGPDPCPLDKRIKDRLARIRAKDWTQTGIHRVRAMQCFILSSRC